MQAFGIFEGGGAKGVAHIGALAAVEEHKIDFIGVAGSSAGAIIAVLVACGYKAEELYSPAGDSGLLKDSFKPFLSDNDQKTYRSIQESLKRIGANKSSYNWVTSLLAEAWSQKKALKHSHKTLGLLTTEHFEAWLEQRLLHKLREHDPNYAPTATHGKVAFKDITLPLKIIASNLTENKIRIFSNSHEDDRDREESVSEAVGASIALPLLFAPKKHNEGLFSDGGLMSNFPVWVFDEERKTAPLLTPTFGFRLVERRNGPLSPKKQDDGQQSPTLMEYLWSVAKAGLFGDNSLETRQVSTLHEILLPVKLLTYDLLADKESIHTAYEAARDATNNYLSRRDTIWKQEPSYISSILTLIANNFRNTYAFSGHLRINIMLPITHDTLKVIYTHNMSDEDCDDMLELPIGCGAAGHCWSSLRPVVCDLLHAKQVFSDKWKMSKYQQRLVRHDLKSLLSVPLSTLTNTQLDDMNIDDHTKHRAFRGVLNFDSDEAIVPIFQDFLLNHRTEIDASSRMIVSLLSNIS
ncbi:patatin-like phospholipase family protein [Planctopirus hydrillae]|uniref:PNPLA domain-containing protein n=1 Tax=Planctopirus hydrillae TaxID=1841610 RepID=A0A1C3E4C3_9PLAN|nr:patatin-like phospholipase family protein [Planctopirus hydrillae]ODA28084.1 hypothetical protein A6X21_14580 [Planctopirus hydrillae]